MKYSAITPPEWFARGSIYQINPRTFSKEGTIKAVSDKIEELAELGFKTLYLCPVFEADDSENRENWSPRQLASQTNNPKNPYRMKNFFEIDSEYGTMQDLKEFIEKAHRFDLKVLLDLVYLHIGPNAEIIKKHPEFAKQDGDGNIIYSPWQFPFLDFTSRGLCEYLWSNMVYYISVFDCDGFRCDSARYVPLEFWEEGKRRICAIKEDAVLLNESSAYHYMQTAFESSYCFKWHEIIYEIVTKERSAKELEECHKEVSESAPKNSLIMRDIENHDTVTDWPPRYEVSAGSDGMELALALNYVIDGIPMVYNGNEIADKTEHNMFANRFHKGNFEATDRDAISTPERARRCEIIKKLNALKLQNDTLRFGKTRWIENDNPQKVICFEREYEGRKILFIANFACEEKQTVINSDFDFEGAKILLQSQSEIKVSGKNLKMPKKSYGVFEIGG